MYAAVEAWPRERRPESSNKNVLARVGPCVCVSSDLVCVCVSSVDTQATRSRVHRSRSHVSMSKADSRAAALCAAHHRISSRKPSAGPHKATRERRARRGQAWDTQNMRVTGGTRACAEAANMHTGCQNKAAGLGYFVCPQRPSTLPIRRSAPLLLTRACGGEPRREQGPHSHCRA